MGLCNIQKMLDKLYFTMKYNYLKSTNKEKFNKKIYRKENA